MILFAIGEHYINANSEPDHQDLDISLVCCMCTRCQIVDSLVLEFKLGWVGDFM